MFSADPSGFQHLPRSEFLKRRAYWLLWKKANRPADDDGESGSTPHPTIPNVWVKQTGDLPKGARIQE